MSTDRRLEDKPRILVIDDQQKTLDSFSSFFREEHGIEIMTASTKEEAMLSVESFTGPTVVILDRWLKNKKGEVVVGDHILPELQKRARFFMVTILYSDDESEDAERNALAAGAYWCVSKRKSMETLMSYVWTAIFVSRQIIEPNEDLLTSALNRRLMFDRAIRELSRAARLGKSIACMILDLDEFKAINETYGHDGGDQVLIGVVRSLRKHLRPTDILCRWGGDEFVMFLFDVEQKWAHDFAHSACLGIASEKIDIDSSDPTRGQIIASASIGVSILTPERIREEMKSAKYAQDRHGEEMGTTPVLTRLVHELIKEADVNLFIEKQKRRTC